MRYKLLAVLLPCALALSACTTVTPAYKDNGTRSGPCVEGGPDDVAQNSMTLRSRTALQDPAALRPYLSDGLAQLLNDARQDPANSKLLQANPFSSSSTQQTAPWSPAPPPSRTVMRAIFRCASRLKQGTQSWKDEVLMIQEGQCWAVDDVRYLGNNSHAPAGRCDRVWRNADSGVEATPLKR
ncbi:lipoprotein [Klebsiella variicola subsp. variicola]|nr:lipoprotein [Klebsiella variicola subsp. variicola]